MAMSKKESNAWFAAHATDDYDLFARVFAELPDETLAKHANSEFFDPDRMEKCVNGPKAWQDEVRKRNQAKEQAKRQEAIDAERATKVAKYKGAMAFSDEIALELCDRVGSGESLTSICANDPRMPTIRRVNAWLREHIEFKALFEMAQQDRLLAFEEDLIRIADDVSLDVDVITTKGNTKRAIDPPKVGLAKLRCFVRQLHLKAYKPQRWGDSQVLAVRSGDEFDLANMSGDELEAKIAALEAKDATVKRSAA
jgi:hypothetical protein